MSSSVAPSLLRRFHREGKHTHAASRRHFFIVHENAEVLLDEEARLNDWMLSLNDVKRDPGMVRR